MGKMGWFAYLIETGDKEGLADFLKERGFRTPKDEAKKFLKAQDEIIEMQMKQKQKDEDKPTHKQSSKKQTKMIKNTISKISAASVGIRDDK